MIDYSELDRYYTGTAIPVLANAGGMLLELGEDINTLFYKLDGDHYADVNNKRIAEVLRRGSVITSHYVVLEDSLVQVGTKKDVTRNASLIRRLTFNPTDYSKK